MPKDKKKGVQKAKSKDDLHDLHKQIEELKSSLLRERADTMNVRKRAEADRIRLGSFYKSVIVKELLPIIDNFERSQKTIPVELKENEYIKGFQGIAKQFADVLKKLGVERIKTVGEHFDPELHDAVTMEEGDGQHEIVSEELLSGYKIDKEILRHAKVRVKNTAN